MFVKNQRINAKTYRRRISRHTAIFVNFAAFILVSLFFYVFFNKYDFFNIKHYDITGAGGFVNTRDLETLAKNRTLGKNIFVLDVKKFEASLIKDFLGAKSIRVTRKFPDKIRISVVERVPAALIFVQKDASMYIVDEDGYVLGISGNTATSLPLINYGEEVGVGQFLNKNVLSAYFNLINLLRDEGIKASSMSVEKKYISFFLDSGVMVLVNLEKDLKSSVSTLNLMLKQLSMDEKKIKKLDLRYDKVIVSYN